MFISQKLKMINDLSKSDFVQNSKVYYRCVGWKIIGWNWKTWFFRKWKNGGSFILNFWFSISHELYVIKSPSKKLMIRMVIKLKNLAGLIIYDSDWLRYNG